MARRRRVSFLMITAAGFVAAGAIATADDAPNPRPDSTGTELGRRIDRLQELAGGGPSEPGGGAVPKLPGGNLDPACLLKSSSGGEFSLNLATSDLDPGMLSVVYGLGLRAAQEHLGPDHWITKWMAASVESRRRIAELSADRQRRIHRAQELSDEGTRLSAEGKHREAARRHEESSHILREELGSTDVTTLTALHAYGDSLYEAGKHRRALRVLRKAEQSCAGAPAAKTPLLAAILDVQECAHYKLEEFDQCVDCAQRATVVWKEIAGPHSPEYFARLVRFLMLLGRLERYEDVEPVCREAMEAAEPIKHRREVAEWLPLFHMCLGGIYFKQKDHARAAESLGLAIAGVEKSPEKDAEAMTDLYEMYAKTLEAAGRSEEAIRAGANAAAWRREANRTSEFPLPQ